MATEGSKSRLVLIIVGITILFVITTFALVAATLGTLIKRFDAIENKLSPQSTPMTTAQPSQSTPMTTVQPSQSTPMTTAQPSQNSTLAGSINIEEILGYLGELQNIANRFEWNSSH